MTSVGDAKSAKIAKTASPPNHVQGRPLNPPPSLAFSTFLAFLASQ